MEGNLEAGSGKKKPCSICLFGFTKQSYTSKKKIKNKKRSVGMNRKASICCLFSFSASCLQLDAGRNRAEQQADRQTADPCTCATPSAQLCASKASRGFSIPSPVWVGACFGDGGGPFCPSESIASSPRRRHRRHHHLSVFSFFISLLLFVCLFVCSPCLSPPCPFVSSSRLGASSSTPPPSRGTAAGLAPPAAGISPSVQKKIK